MRSTRETSRPLSSAGVRRLIWRCSLAPVVCLILSVCIARAQYPSSSQVTKDGTEVLMQDYASMPLSSLETGDVYPAPIDYHGQLSRVNALRSEPANAPLSASRLFVIDMNGIIYILDKNTKKFTPYIDFGKVFPKFNTGPGYGAGVVSIAFDPDYAKNGKFYTVHTENPSKRASAIPTNAGMPGLNLTGYTTTDAINPPAGGASWQSVLVEWTDTNINDSKFEGSAREILRVGFFGFIHQMGDLLFDPLAKPGQPDYGNLYISVGDGSAGETPGVTHPTPQRLDALQGKILRITPDINLRSNDKLSSNGRYRIPSTGTDPNPFVSYPTARGEIYAYGLRNPHRITWDVVSNSLIADDIGLHSWEEVDIIRKGGNYGYAEREGNELLLVPDGGKTASQMSPPVPFPARDLLTVDGLPEPIAPLYPAATYSHREGDSIGSGFVYRGRLMPQMRGKYIFTDMTTGRLFYTDLKQMIASSGIRNKEAQIHEIQIAYKNPYDNPAQTPAKRRMYDIDADGFAHRGGINDPNQGVLPGGNGTILVGGGRGSSFVPGKTDAYGVQYAGGRADVRLSMDGDGEIYVLSKSDGMIRKLGAVVAPPPSSK